VGSSPGLGKLEFLSISGCQKSRQNGLSDNVLFDTAPVSLYVVNEGADNKLNSMDSVLASGHRKCGDRAKLRPLQPIAMAYLKPGQGQHDLFLNVLGNQSSHFDQLVLCVGIGLKIFCIIFQD